jgi:hypothetical protein
MQEKKKTGQANHICAVCGEEFQNNDLKRAQVFDEHNEVMPTKGHRCMVFFFSCFIPF